MKKITKVFLIYFFSQFFIFSIYLFSADTDIRLNFLGFLPDMEKRASIAALCSDFYIKRSSDNTIVFSGTVIGPINNSDTSETIYIADFSSLQTPGTYYIEVPGVGVSYNFNIGYDIYLQPFKTVFRGFYLWRCGTNVSTTYNGTTFSHAACHLNDAYLDYVGGGHNILDGVGGWHDAGDYGKYVVNAGVTLGVLFKAWEHFKDKIQLVNLDIPNVLSGDSLYPDFLKELRWEINWLLKMQMSDGRVYHKLTRTDFSGPVMPENDTADRYFVPWSSAATADFVAVMAMASRIFAPYDSTFSDTCLSAARVSYAYLTNNPTNHYADDTGFSTGSYQTDDADDRLWAAAEMWETTGESVFLNDFETRASSYSNKIDWAMDWGSVKNLGMITYYLSTKAGKDSAIVNDIRNDILSTANSYVSNRNSHGYGRLLGTSYWWGSNGTVARNVLILQVANMISPNLDYLNTALDAIGYLAGRNYYCRSFITGVGHNPPLYPHDRRSSADGITPPWPGYLVGGPNSSATDWQDDSNDYYTNEIAINWNSALVYAMAGFLENPPTNTPTPTITGTPPTPTMTPTITLTFTITPTYTITPTPDKSFVEIEDHYTYPNPSKGYKVTFKYKIKGFAKIVYFHIYTFGNRLIDSKYVKNKTYGWHECIWRPGYKLANGVYLYIIEAEDKNGNLKRRIGSFGVIKK